MVRKKCRGKKKIKKGGFLPLLPLLGAIGALAGGGSAVYNAINNAKAAKRNLEEIVRHNKAMEGKGLKYGVAKKRFRVRNRKRNLRLKN